MYCTCWMWTWALQLAPVWVIPEGHCSWLPATHLPHAIVHVTPVSPPVPPLLPTSVLLFLSEMPSLPSVRVLLAQCHLGKTCLCLWPEFDGNLCRQPVYRTTSLAGSPHLLGWNMTPSLPCVQNYAAFAVLWYLLAWAILTVPPL